eukprot:CAMPEP_0194288154 /NCGR_PEP_ID=MMETSP0169-20130528/36230_1 /TAXON_ID=218684 /ORGANISM="Corethron pennatum, Strain L29A3" /LENGTH=513 /DNA_ID=CAMNT_0039035069 /DNA_START=80 /DNA_END=1621 /DNA_ORIENTATION=-
MTSFLTQRLRIWYDFHPEWSTAAIAVSNSVAYALSYFWRYPVFMLPSEIADRHAATLFDRDLDTQVCLSLAFVLGFGCAKPLAMGFVTSPSFFRWRLEYILGLMAGSALVEGFGTLLFRDSGAAIALCVFVSSFLSSFLFGAMVTYLEGRRATETLLAVSSGCLIYAGNASRGAAAAVLGTGLPPAAMPLLVAAVACPIACVLVVAVDAAPRPSPEDVAARSARGDMDGRAKRAFCRDWRAGVCGTLVPAYALIAAVRSFRDLYAGRIFAASAGLSDPKDVPPAAFFLADFPGAVLSVLALLVFGQLRSNKDAMWRMLLTVMVAIAVPVLGATVLFQQHVIGGSFWQLSLGSGIFVAFSIMGTPFYERLFAYARVEGTVSFLIFGSDMVAYVATLSIFLAQILGPQTTPEPSLVDSTGDNQDPILKQFLLVLWCCGTLILVLLVLSSVHFRRRLFGPTAQPDPDGKLLICGGEEIDINDLSDLELLPSHSGSSNEDEIDAGSDVVNTPTREIV